MDVKIRKATLKDVNVISNIYALSWKSSYKGIVPQKYLESRSNIKDSMRPGKRSIRQRA